MLTSVHTDYSVSIGYLLSTFLVKRCFVYTDVKVDYQGAVEAHRGGGGFQRNLLKLYLLRLKLRLQLLYTFHF